MTRVTDRESSPACIDGEPSVRSATGIVEQASMAYVGLQAKPNFHVTLTPWREDPNEQTIEPLFLRNDCTEAEGNLWTSQLVAGRCVRVEFELEPPSPGVHPYIGRLVRVVDPGPIVGHGLVPKPDALDITLGRLVWEEQRYRGQVRFHGGDVAVYVEGGDAAVPDASALHRRIEKRYDEYLDHVVAGVLEAVNGWRGEEDMLTAAEYRSCLAFDTIVYRPPGAWITIAQGDVDEHAIVLGLDAAGDPVALDEM